MKKRRYVVGAGTVGRTLVREAAPRGGQWAVLEADPREAESLALLPNVQAFHMSELSLDLMGSVGVERASILIAAADDDEQNMRIVTYAQELGVDTIIALGREPDHAKILRRLGARVVVIEGETVSRRLHAFAEFPALDDAVELEHGPILGVTRVEEGSPLVGRLAEDLIDPGLRHGAPRVVDVCRDGQHLDPAKAGPLRAKDLVTLLFLDLQAVGTSLTALLR